ncbi:MAG: phenylalanine--tRNA ligase beta subunit-related protein, partial [Patescibacteria group bacterium]
RSWKAFIDNSDENLSRAFEMAQIGESPQKESLFLPRFRDVANFAQLPNVELLDRMENIKGAKLSALERDILKERLIYAYIWINKYAPDEYRYQLSRKTYDEIELSEDEWQFLNDLAIVWKDATDPEILHSEIFRLAKQKNINLNSAFRALYTVVLDKSYGPRAGWLLKKFPVDSIITRLTLNKNSTDSKQTSTAIFFNKPDYFEIDTLILNKYPTVSVGIALIKNVQIRKSLPDLEKEKQELLTSLAGLTTEQLGKYPEIVSYRKLYKEMGVDWHSRRPSPEALLRRVVLGKGLYTINACVDAYNLVVMKYMVSVGAFDANQVKFPTVLRYAGEGDEILLLGDKEPTKYSAKEIAYYDKKGAYNIDFNFRDAQRTKVTESTKNIWINVDGVYDITPEQVEKSLEESVKSIIKYCGGTVEFQGIVK